MTNPSPTVPRRRLGHELVRLRKGSGLNGDQVAVMMEWSSSSKLYRIENGRQGIQPKELRELLGYYGITESAVVDELVTMARQGKQRAWWAQYASAVHDSYTTYVGLESAATALRSYEPTGINGLLQTEEYARALFESNDHLAAPSAAAVDSKVRLRMERQSVLTRDDPLHLWAIIDESALRRTVGDSDVMGRQFERLVRDARTRNITLQVLPLSEVDNPSLPTNFTIFGFPEDDEQDAVYVELLTGAIFVEGADVHWYNLTFDGLRAAALSATKSIALIKDIASGRG